MTIYGYKNSRFFVPADNPHGHIAWFASREARDQARAVRIKDAREHGLTDAEEVFPTVERRIRGERAEVWLGHLVAKGVLLANGLDGPAGEPSHSWEDAS